MELQNINKKKHSIFSCFNLYTLCISYAYSEYLYNHFGFHSTILWRETVLKLPLSVLENYEGDIKTIPVSHIMNDHNTNKFSKLRHLKKEKKLRKHFLLTYFSINTGADILFVFKDNTMYDIEIIKFYRKFSKGKIVLIEEGNGIYESSLGFETFHKKIKRFILGLPKETSKDQGQSKLWDYVICKYPDLFNKTNNRDIVLQQSKIFDSKYLTKFFKLFQINQTANINFDFIYFSQPLSESGLITNNQEIQTINTILANIPSNKKVGIKLHQRENCNKFEDVVKKFPNVEILGQLLQSLPGEIIYFYLKPILLTPFSSVATNILFQDPSATIILLYKYFPLPGKTNIEVEKLFNGRNVLTNLEEYSLIKMVNKTKNGANTDTLALDEIIQIFSRGL